MPIGEYGYSMRDTSRTLRRKAMIKKWRDMGCTEGKILSLIQRRIRSKRQWW